MSVDQKSKPSEPTSLLSAATFPPEKLRCVLSGDKSCYTNLDKVIGTIEYSPELAGPDNVLVVQLLGISHVALNKWMVSTSSYRHVRTEWPFLRQLCPTSLDPVSRTSGFSFELPTSLQPLQCPMGDPAHLALPPSISSAPREDGLFDLTSVGACWRIAYQVRAELRSRATGDVLGHTTVPFMVVPQTRLFRGLSHILPEAQIEQDRYTQKIQTLLSKTVGSMTLSLKKDRVIHTSGMGPTVTSSLQMSFEYKGPSPPSFLKASFVLVARTIRRTTHQSNFKLPEHTNIVHRDMEGTRFGGNGQKAWRQSNTELDTWTRETTLPITLIEDSDVVVLPNFESCLASRRYELLLTISLSAPSSLMILHSVKYLFPITVEFDSERLGQQVTAVMGGPPVNDDGEESARLCTVPSYEEVSNSPPVRAPMVPVPEYDDPIPALELLRRPSWQDKGETRSESDLQTDVSPSCTCSR